MQFAAGSWSTASGATSPAAQLSATIRDGAGKANSTSSVKRGPLSISGPKISIEDIKFNLKPATGGGLPDTADVVVTVGLGADSGSLKFGSDAQRSKSGVALNLTGIMATFDIAVSLNIPAILGMNSEPKIRTGGFTGKFSLDVATLDLTVPNVVNVNATGISIQMNPQIDTDGDGQISSAEQAAFDAREILRVDDVTVTIPKISASGTLQPYTRTNGTTIPGLQLRNNGFTLGDASLTKAGPIMLGSVLELGSITAGVTDFKIGRAHV